MLDSRKVSYDENHVITSMSRVNFFTGKSPPMLKINSVTFSAYTSCKHKVLESYYQK